MGPGGCLMAVLFIAVIGGITGVAIAVVRHPAAIVAMVVTLAVTGLGLYFVSRALARVGQPPVEPAYG